MIPLIVLAAGQGTRLRPLTNDVPKCMVPLHGKPLLHWHLGAARSAGVHKVVLVEGFARDRLVADVDVRVFNAAFATTNMVSSLWCARPHFGDGFLMSYGDIVFNPSVVKAALQGTHDVDVVVDRSWLSYWQQRTDDVLSDAESLRLDDRGRISAIGQKETSIGNIQGQYIGMVRFSPRGMQAAEALLERERAANLRGERLLTPKRDHAQLYMTDLLQGLIQSGMDVYPVFTDGGWLEVDSVPDLQVAEKLSRVEHGELKVER